MLPLKLQAKDDELTLLPPPHKLKSDPFPKQSQDQSLFHKLNTLDLSLVSNLKSAFKETLRGVCYQMSFKTYRCLELALVLF